MRVAQHIVVTGGFVLSLACSGSDGPNNDAMNTGVVIGASTGGVPGGSSGGVTSTGGSIAAGGSTPLGNPGALPGGSANGGSVGTGGAIGVAGATGAPGGGASGAGGMSNGGAGGMSNGGASGSAGMGTAGAGGGTPGMCCSDGKCLCHGDAPTALTSSKGPYMTKSYTIQGTGCVFYPTDAQPPFAAVVVSDGFGGAGGCNSGQTGQWGPLYASWGIVAMIIDTGASDQPQVRGMKLSAAIAAYKTENTKMGSPLMGKLAGRYGTSGFSMGGGGTTYAAKADPTLLTNVAIMPWGPVSGGIQVPSLYICGSSDTLAGCSSMGTPSFDSIPDTVPKMRVTIQSGHAGQPSAGMGKSGQYGLAFQKVFLEGDTRWRPLLVAAMSDETNIK